VFVVIGWDNYFSFGFTTHLKSALILPLTIQEFYFIGVALLYFTLKGTRSF